jgi:hypothetical protein
VSKGKIAHHFTGTITPNVISVGRPHDRVTALGKMRVVTRTAGVGFIPECFRPFCLHEIEDVLKVMRGTRNRIKGIIDIIWRGVMSGIASVPITIVVIYPVKGYLYGTSASVTIHAEVL